MYSTASHESTNIWVKKHKNIICSGLENDTAIVNFGKSSSIGLSNRIESLC